MGSRIGSGVPLTNQARAIIYNVHDYFVQETLKFKRSHGGHFYSVQKRCVEALGISKTTINRLLSNKFRLSPGCEMKNARTRDVQSKGSKSYAQLSEIIYNVYLYFVKEYEEYGTVEDKYFNDVEDRVVKATGICQSVLTSVLNGKENRAKKESKSKTMSQSTEYVFDSKTLEMVPMVISCESGSDSEPEVSILESFAISQ